MTQELIEELAALEHRQWMHWSQSVADNYNLPQELIEKWEENWIEYDQLDEKAKEMDREWARKAMEIVNKK